MAETVTDVVPPKQAMVPAVDEAERGVPHGKRGFAGELEFLGGAALVAITVKSAELLLESVCPPLFRTITDVDVIPVTAAPSAQVEVPQATLSTKVPAISDPQAKLLLVALNNATLPEVPDMDKAVVAVEKSAVRVVPAVPLAPVCTKMYFPDGMMVFAGKLKMLEVLAPQFPVAEPYSKAHPPILTDEHPEL